MARSWETSRVSESKFCPEIDPDTFKHTCLRKPGHFNVFLPSFSAEWDASVHVLICILKAKKKKRSAFHQRFTYSWRCEKSILEQSRVIIEEAARTHTRRFFPPEDMRFDDSSRWRHWSADTRSMFTTHAISKGMRGVRVMASIYNMCPVR